MEEYAVCSALQTAPAPTPLSPQETLDSTDATDAADDTATTAAAPTGDATRSLEDLLADEARDAYWLNAYLERHEVLDAAVKARNVPLVLCLSKIALYKDLIRAGALGCATSADEDAKIDRILAAAAYRDTQIIRTHELDLAKNRTEKASQVLRRRISLAEAKSLRVRFSKDDAAFSFAKGKKREAKGAASGSGSGAGAVADGLTMTPCDHWEALGRLPWMMHSASQRYDVSKLSFTSTLPPHHELMHNCYICRINFPRILCMGTWQRVDGGHASVCPSCCLKNFNAIELVKRADLRGWTVVITGCRHTVGFSAAMLALRAGATVIGTTRFPRAAYLNFQQQPDFDCFKDRLELLELDFLRHDHLHAFCRWLATHPRGAAVDAFISNAFLTVQQTPAYYASLTALEDRFEHLLHDSAVAAAEASASDSTLTLTLGGAIGNVWLLEQQVRPRGTTTGSIDLGLDIDIGLGMSISTQTEAQPLRTLLQHPMKSPPLSSYDTWTLKAETLFRSTCLEDVDMDAPLFKASDLDLDLDRNRGSKSDGPRDTILAIVNEHNNLDEPVGRRTLWTETLQDSTPASILESTIVNQVAPTLLLQAVCEVMKRNPKSRRVLINVTSTEHRHVTSTHAVTGMHKAAMEALWYKLAHEAKPEERFEACSVDPGFVTGVRGTQMRKPLTSLDGGARVMHPIAMLACQEVEPAFASAFSSVSSSSSSSASESAMVSDMATSKPRLPKGLFVLKNFGKLGRVFEPFSYAIDTQTP